MSETREEPGKWLIQISTELSHATLTYPPKEEHDVRLGAVLQWTQGQIPAVQFSCHTCCVTWASYLPSLHQGLQELSGASLYIHFQDCCGEQITGCM